MSVQINIFKDRIYPVLFMVLLTIVFISVISSIHILTLDIVKLNETIAEKKAVIYASGLDLPDSNEEINALFEARVDEFGEGASRYFEIMTTSGDPIYVFTVYGAGLWGEIITLFGVESDLKTITGIEFLKQNETPGLGARILEPWFKEQFRGKELGFLRMTPEADQIPAGEGEFDAITGATRTSDAIQGIVVKAAQEAQKILGGVQ
jgi:Na+-transporting NADH:ubiquinone oxidoreductase subunit C